MRMRNKSLILNFLCRQLAKKSWMYVLVYFTEYQIRNDGDPGLGWHVRFNNTQFTNADSDRIFNDQFQGNPKTTKLVI